jgi:hypothetical protein
MMNMTWLYYGEHQVASLSRSQGGSITVNMEWLYMGDH